MKEYLFLPLFMVAALPFLAGCDSHPQDNGDDSHPQDNGDNEHITYVRLFFSAPDRCDVVAEWSDADGPGGAAPTITVVDRFRVGGNYSGTILIKRGNQDVTAEVAAKRETHQFFYTPGGVVSEATVSHTDATDGAGKPVGLTFSLSFQSVASGSGTLRVELLRYDQAQDKQANSRAGGETYVDVSFPVTLLWEKWPSWRRPCVT